MDLPIGSMPPVTERAASTMVMPSLPFLKRLRDGAAVPRRSDGGVDLVQQTGPSPLWNGARRASSEFARSSGRRGADTIGVSVVISNQTGGSGAPETTDGQPCSGGPSRELPNIIGELGLGRCSAVKHCCCTV